MSAAVDFSNKKVPLFLPPERGNKTWSLKEHDISDNRLTGSSWGN